MFEGLLLPWQQIYHLAFYSILAIRERIVIALFTCQSEDKLGPCSIKCHIHAMTGNCSVILGVRVGRLFILGN